ELAKVKARLAELRVRMPVYRLESLPADSRKLFEFAKALNIETLVGSADSAALPELDKLANEFGINVSLIGNPKNLSATLSGRGKRIGMDADPAKWTKDDLRVANGRVMTVNLRDRKAGVPEFLLEMS